MVKSRRAHTKGCHDFHRPCQSSDSISKYATPISSCQLGAPSNGRSVLCKLDLRISHHWLQCYRLGCAPCNLVKVHHCFAKLLPGLPVSPTNHWAEIIKDSCTHLNRNFEICCNQSLCHKKFSEVVCLWGRSSKNQTNIVNPRQMLICLSMKNFNIHSLLQQPQAIMPFPSNADLCKMLFSRNLTPALDKGLLYITKVKEIHFSDIHSVDMFMVSLWHLKCLISTVC
jgi:hypothetical protein